MPKLKKLIERKICESLQVYYLYLVEKFNYCDTFENFLTDITKFTKEKSEGVKSENN